MSVTAVSRRLNCSTRLVGLSSRVFHLGRAGRRLRTRLQFGSHVVTVVTRSLHGPLATTSVTVRALRLNCTPGRAHGLDLDPRLAKRLLGRTGARIQTVGHVVASVLGATQKTSVSLRLRPRRLTLPPLYFRIIRRFSSHVRRGRRHLIARVPGSLPSICTSNDRIGHIVAGLLSGTVGCAPRNKRISLATLRHAARGIRIKIISANPNVPTRGHSGVFRRDFQLRHSSARRNCNLKLTLYRHVIQTRCNRI